MNGAFRTGGITAHTGAVTANGDGSVQTNIPDASSPVHKKAVGAAVQLGLQVVRQTGSCFGGRKRFHSTIWSVIFLIKANTKVELLPELKVKGEELLLHDAVEATTTAEYWCPQSTFTEQVVELVEQETVWLWVPVKVAL